MFLHIIIFILYIYIQFIHFLVKVLWNGLAGFIVKNLCRKLLTVT